MLLPATEEVPDMAHSVQEYLALKGDEDSSIVSDLLPRSGALNIFGAPKAGKSYLSLQLADAIGSPHNASFLGFPVKTHGPVLYLQIDTPRNIWIDRVGSLVAKGLSFENVYFSDRLDCPEVTFNILNPAHEAWLIREVGERNYLAVIVDTLRETFDGDENDSNQMKLVVAKLVKATAPAALVLVSHARKPAKDQPSGIMQNGRGSSYVAGRMDALMEVKTNRLTAQSRTLAETVVSVRQVEDSGLFTPDEPHATLAKQVLLDHPDAPLRETARILQERLGGKKTLEACRSILRRLQG
jgi:RecA-family ATPase